MRKFLVSPLFEKQHAQAERTRNAVLDAREAQWAAAAVEADRELRDWEARVATAASDDPLAAALAEKIMARLPRWAESEECDVTVVDVAESLAELNLRLERREA